MNAYEFVRGIKHLPANDDGDLPSNSDIRRWFDRRSVLINGDKPSWKEDISLPITELVFFPKGKRKTTYL